MKREQWIQTAILKNLIFKNESSNTQHDPLAWSMGPALRAGERKLHLGSNPSHAIGEHGNNPGQTVAPL